MCSLFSEYTTLTQSFVLKPVLPISGPFNHLQLSTSLAHHVSARSVSRLLASAFEASCGAITVYSQYACARESKSRSKGFSGKS